MSFSLSKTLLAMGPNGDRPWRKDAFTDVVEGYTVDTVKASDTGKWETAIEPKGESRLIVEQYEQRDAAKLGHDKWVSEIKAGRRDFPEITYSISF